MKPHVFSFYKVLKNEDAMPFIHLDKDSGFMIAADGLGGSGSFVHRFSEAALFRIESELKYSVLPEHFKKLRDKAKKEEDHSSKTALLQNTETDSPATTDEEQSPVDELSDKKDEAIKAESAENDVPAAPESEISQEYLSWFESLMKDIADPAPHTSALWGSRVLISRLAYYLLTHKDIDLSDESTREKIVRFVYEGLYAVRNDFKLSVEGSTGLSVLPSTLVALRYTLENGAPVAEVIWAGDSRAYAVIPGEGIKQLTADDEDDSGAITNLFSIKPEKESNTHLNYAKFKLPEKCLLFVCSDGFFDLYDRKIESIGVECALLSSIANATSFESFKKEWNDYFVPTGHDDCSVAFAAFGFEGFDEMKAAFAERCKMLSAVYNEFNSCKKLIPIALGEESSPEESIVERAYVRIEQISELIFGEAYKNPESKDPAITADVKEFFRNTEASKQKKLQDEKQKREAAARERLEALLKDDCTAVRVLFDVKDNVSYTDSAKIIASILDELKASEAIFFKASEAEKALKKAEEGLQKAEDNGNSVVQKIEETKANNSQLHSQIQEWIREGRALLRENKLDKGDFSSFYRICDELSSQKCTYSDAVRAWENRDRSYKSPSISRGNKLRIIDTLCDAITTYQTARDEKRRRENACKAVLADAERAQNKLKDAVNELCGRLGYIIMNGESFLSADGLSVLSLPVKVNDIALSEAELKADFLDYIKENKDSVYRSMIDAFICSTEPSVIERFFNQAKLSLLREYKCADIGKIIALFKEVQDIVAINNDISSIKA